MIVGNQSACVARFRWCRADGEEQNRNNPLNPRFRVIPNLKLYQSYRYWVTDISCADGKVRLLSSGATQLSLYRLIPSI